MKRLIIVYNPRSARYAEVERKVILPSRKLKGWMVARFEVEHGSVETNAVRLAEIIRKGDLVLSAGGDGTATMVLNALMMADKRATMAVMGFGNFNDYVGTFGEMTLEEIVRRFEEGRMRDFYPVEIRLDGKHFRYFGMYCSVGLMAEATEVFERKKVRRKMGRVKNRLSYSGRKLAGWYLKNKWRKDFLPEKMTIGKKGVAKGTTDYVALNGERMAGILEPQGWGEQSERFWSGTMRNRSLFRMFGKFLRALEGGYPGSETSGDLLKLGRGSRVFLHAEGEGLWLERVKEIEIRKTGESVRVIRK